MGRAKSKARKTRLYNRVVLRLTRQELGREEPAKVVHRGWKRTSFSDSKIAPMSRHGEGVQNKKPKKNVVLTKVMLSGSKPAFQHLPIFDTHRR